MADNRKVVSEHARHNELHMDDVREWMDDARRKIAEVESAIPGAMKGPYVGQIVQFKVPSGMHPGELRPGVVVHVHEDHPDHPVDLQVWLHEERDEGYSERFHKFVKRGDRLAEYQTVVPVDPTDLAADSFPTGP